jgi:hypothetical protein
MRINYMSDMELMSDATGPIFPGEFEVEKAELHLSSGDKVNLADPNTALLTFTFTEDIEESAIQGELIFLDSVSAASRGPIVGGEVIDMKIRTSSEFRTDDVVMDFSKNNLIVTGLGKYETSGHETIGSTSVTFCSQEIVENYRTRVSQSFEGTYSDIVEEIMEKIIKSGKNLYIEPSVGKKKIVTPNIPPFDVISLAMEEATNDQLEPTYYFYETTMGYHFRTLMDMYDPDNSMGKRVFKYRDAPHGLRTPSSGTQNWLQAIGTILDYDILPRTNLLNNLDYGTYSSKLIEHDIYNKTYYEYEYDYFEKENLQIRMSTQEGEGEPIYSQKQVVNGKTLSEDKMETFLVPTSLKKLDAQSDAQHSSTFGTSAGNFPEYGFVGKNGKDWVQRRNSMRTQISDGEGATCLRLIVHGNTLVNAGDVIELDITERHMAGAPANPDPVLSGPFLVKSVRHEINISGRTSHMMELIVIRDGFPFKIPAAGKSPSKGSFRKIESYYESF